MTRLIVVSKFCVTNILWSSSAIDQMLHKHNGATYTTAIIKPNKYIKFKITCKQTPNHNNYNYYADVAVPAELTNATGVNSQQLHPIVMLKLAGSSEQKH